MRHGSGRVISHAHCSASSEIASERIVHSLAVIGCDVCFLPFVYQTPPALYSQLARSPCWVAHIEGVVIIHAPRRLLIPSLIGLLALVVVGALAIFAAPRALQTLHLGGPDIREAAQVSMPRAFIEHIGLPAIAPHNDCTPSFTARDGASTSENTHPFAAMRVEAVGKPKITKIWFITSAEASGQMHGESTGLSDDALVCYVEFYGTFRTGSAPGGEPTERTGTASSRSSTRTPAICSSQVIISRMTPGLLISSLRCPWTDQGEEFVSGGPRRRSVQASPVRR